MQETVELLQLLRVDNTLSDRVQLIVHCRGAWCCVQCNSAYDLEDIEQYMIDAIQRKSMAFSLQDVRCVKCKAVSLIYFLLTAVCFLTYRITVGICVTGLFFQKITPV